MRGLLARAMAIGIGLAACMAGAAQPSAAPPGWREFVMPAAGFKVLVPAWPKTTRQTIPTEIGKVAATRYTVTDANNVTYDVLLNDYPPAGLAKASPDKLLDGARDGLVYQTRGRLIAEERITVAGFPGRNQEYVGAKGEHYRVRLIWAGSRLYQVMTVTPGKPRPEAGVFFDSFQLTGR